MLGTGQAVDTAMTKAEGRGERGADGRFHQRTTQPLEDERAGQKTLADIGTSLV
jgi:hypothetical protein